jgi:hypothetical protein
VCVHALKGLARQRTRHFGEIALAGSLHLHAAPVLFAYADVTEIEIHDCQPPILTYELTELTFVYIALLQLVAACMLRTGWPDALVLLAKHVKPILINPAHTDATTACLWQTVSQQVASVAGQVVDVVEHAPLLPRAVTAGLCEC